jgi:hypothetical protein
MRRPPVGAPSPRQCCCGAAAGPRPRPAGAVQLLALAGSSTVRVGHGEVRGARPGRRHLHRPGRLLGPTHPGGGSSTSWGACRPARARWDWSYGGLRHSVDYLRAHGQDRVGPAVRLRRRGARSSHARPLGRVSCSLISARASSSTSPTPTASTTLPTQHPGGPSGPMLTGFPVEPYPPDEVRGDAAGLRAWLPSRRASPRQPRGPRRTTATHVLGALPRTRCLVHPWRGGHPYKTR